MIATTDLAQRTLDQGESVPAASWNNNTQPALHLPPAAVRFAHMTIDDAAQSAWQPVGHVLGHLSLSTILFSIKWTTQEEVALGLGARVLQLMSSMVLALTLFGKAQVLIGC
ncbi:hypothetical protein ACS0TY_034298 [Phlomoides rotata]